MTPYAVNGYPMSVRRILFLAPAQSVTKVFPELRDAGFEVGIAENLKGASAFIRKATVNAIFTRLKMPGYRADDILFVGQEDPDFPPVYIFTEKGTPEEAERLMNLGARDYCPTLGGLTPPPFRRQLQHFFFFTFGSYDTYGNTWSARPSSEIS
jgi:CheY-like chemotaxis protein